MERSGPETEDPADPTVPPDSDRDNTLNGEGTALGDEEPHEDEGQVVESRCVSEDTPDEPVSEDITVSGIGPADELDALSALLFGWGEMDNEEIERLAMEYQLPKRPHPMREANRAYRAIIVRHTLDPDRKNRVGVAPGDEATAVSYEVYCRSTVKLTCHLFDYYKEKRDEKPMNRALQSTLAYFRYHFPSDPRDIRYLTRTVNLLVGKLRTRCLADSVADDLGVDAYHYDSRQDRRLIHPDVKAAMEGAEERWTTDDVVLEQKEGWARERIAELVRLVFDTAGSVHDAAEERMRVPNHGPYAYGARGKLSVRFPFNNEYMTPELLDVWTRLGLMQLGSADDIAET